MKTRFFQKTALLIIVCTLGLYSCTEKDYYDPNISGGEKENPLGIQAPSNMDWSMISTINLAVNVDDEYNGDYYYIVEVYGKNPLFAEEPNLLAKGVAKKGKAFTASIETIAGQNTLYIKRTDPRGRSVVGSVELQEGISNVKYDFASDNAAVAVRSLAATRAQQPPTYDKVPAGAIEVTGSATNNDWFKEGQVYCITEDYNGGIYHSGLGKCQLFVSGTWTIPEDATNWNHQIERGLEIVVLPGGKIIDKGNKISFVGTSELVVMSGGNFECNELEFSNSGVIYNLGIIKANYITLKSQTTLYNDCSVVVDYSFIADASNVAINMTKGSIQAKYIVFNNVKLSLNDGCLIKAEDELDNMSNTVYTATGATSMVASKNVKCTSSVVYSGSLVVEAVTHTEGDAWWSPYSLQKGAKLAKPGQANVFIETCNGGSHQPDPGTDPSDPTFPIEIVTSADYIFAMEDQWPAYGDYDMNDVVVGISPQISNYVDREYTKVKQVKFAVRVLAVGAFKQIAAAIQLDKIVPDQVESVDYYLMNAQKLLGESFLLSANRLESNQDKAVVPLFENANNLLGGNFVNVRESGETDPVEFTVVVNFKDNANVKPEDLGHKALNFFIIPDLIKIQPGQKRTEVHLGGYSPTNLVNETQFGSENDNGTQKYISKNDNLVWGLIIPTNRWECPNEGVSITKIYSHFAEWVTSGGKNYPDWYKEK